MKNRTKVMILLLVLMLTIGFAAVTTSIIIDGTTYIGSKFSVNDVYFKEANMDNGTYVMSTDKKQITFTTNTLKSTGEEAILSYVVINDSSQYDANVSISIQNNSTVNNVDYSSYYSITTEGFNPGEEVLLKSMNEKTGKIIIKLLKIPTENVSLTIVVELEADPIELEEEGKPETKLLYDVIASSLTKKTYNNFDVGKVDTLSQLSNPKKIYYELEENTKHIIFANKCWTLLRTTETGGTKIMYNGEAENGQCLDGRTPYISNTYLDESYMYDEYLNIGDQYVYFYNEETGEYISFDFYVGTDFVYDDNTKLYTLSGEVIHHKSSNSYRVPTVQRDKHYYACFNSSMSCSHLAEILFYYDHYSNPDDGYLFYYMILENGGKNLSEIINNPNPNINDSNTKKNIENWFENSLIDYQEQLEDIYMCNDRRPNPANNEYLYLNMKYTNGRNEIINDYSQTIDHMSCDRLIDNFSVSNNVAPLKYPVGLPSLSEINNVVNLNRIDLSNYYVDYFDSLEHNIPKTVTPIIRVYQTGDANNDQCYLDSFGEIVKPVISLNKDVMVSSGIGTKESPYVIN